MLVSPSFEFVNYVERSAHFLNCPKHILNHDLDCMYRQSKGLNNGKAVEWISSYLKQYKIENPIESAKSFVAFRESISIREFNELNVNSYIDKLPPHIQAKNNSVSKWIEQHTEYYPTLWGGAGKKIIKSIASYPFLKR